MAVRWVIPKPGAPCGTLAEAHAAARHLAAQGATVVLGARRVERLNALVDEITRGGGNAYALATDVTDLP
jgi:NADP-dependent 3-hydroxy acid dehydrogenase YdfG